MDEDRPGIATQSLITLMDHLSLANGTAAQQAEYRRLLIEEIDRFDRSEETLAALRECITTIGVHIWRQQDLISRLRELGAQTTVADDRLKYLRNLQQTCFLALQSLHPDTNVSFHNAIPAALHAFSQQDMARAEGGELGTQAMDQWSRAHSPPAGSQVIPDQADLLAAIVSASDDAIISKTLDGTITSWNAAATRIFGYEADEMIGTSIFRLIPAAFREEETEILTRLQRGERIDHFETIRLAKDGRDVYVSLTISPIKDKRGSITGASKVARDITERRELGQRMRKLQAELARVSQSNAMGHLASIVAHELKQPLAAISNYMNAAKRFLAMPVDETKLIRSQELLEKAAKQAIRSGQLIDHLRQFFSKGELSEAETDLNGICDDAIALVMSSVPDRPITVKRKFQTGLAPVYLDRMQIQQVLTNLIRNAVEAVYDSDRRILTVETKELADNFVQVSVYDSGSGLPPEVAAKLFEPFVTSKQTGMGLGLSLCKTIVERHNGHIWAEPNKGGGTTFRFTIATNASSRTP